MESFCDHKQHQFLGLNVVPFLKELNRLVLVPDLMEIFCGRSLGQTLSCRVIPDTGITTASKTQPDFFG